MRREVITMPTIGDCMKRRVISFSPETTVRETAHVVARSRIGTLPVVDAGGVLLGVARLEDILRVFMPAFVSLLQDIDFVDVR